MKTIENIIVDVIVAILKWEEKHDILKCIAGFLGLCVVCFVFYVLWYLVAVATGW